MNTRLRVVGSIYYRLAPVDISWNSDIIHHVHNRYHIISRRAVDFWYDLLAESYILEFESEMYRTHFMLQHGELVLDDA